MSDNSPSISKLSVSEVVAMYKKLGIHVDEKTVNSDIEHGAPTNDDGTINLITYTSWLIKEVANKRGN